MKLYRIIYEICTPKQYSYTISALNEMEVIKMAENNLLLSGYAEYNFVSLTNIDGDMKRKKEDFNAVEEK